MAYHKLIEPELKTVKKVEEITFGDYRRDGKYIPVEELFSMIEDLLIELDRAEEKYNDLEEQLRENYRPIPVAEQYGISERDFI